MINIEVIAIGSEILKGSIINSNATKISQALLSAGYSTTRHTVLPDDLNSLKEGLQEALKRNQIVICTGGLGPTCDDVTRQIAAELFHSDFYLDVKLMDALKQRYRSTVISLENQATVPTKAIVLKNDLGTAPGLIFHTEAQTLILMPGVPKEMLAILHQEVIPYLLKNFPHFDYESLILHFFELSESIIDPSLRELQKQFPDIEFGIYPSQGLVKVDLMTRGNVGDLPIVAKILMNRFSENFLELSTGTIESTVQKTFIDNHWTLSIAESCTGGAVSCRLCQVPGASKYFLGSLVCYSNVLKRSLLHVPKDVLSTYGAVSEQTVKAMVLGLLDSVDSDFGIAISGIAGPTGETEFNPVGTVWIAVMQRGYAPKIKKIDAHGSREMIIERSVNAALFFLLTSCHF